MTAKMQFRMAVRLAVAIDAGSDPLDDRRPSASSESRQRYVIARRKNKDPSTTARPPRPSTQWIVWPRGPVVRQFGKAMAWNTTDSSRQRGIHRPSDASALSWP